MSRPPIRLAPGPDGRFGRLIDRSRPLAFTFDGRRYRGFEGDTLASALMGNGVRLIGRSVKFHRPRGIVGIGTEEPNALVSVGEADRRTPNLPATAIRLHDGLVATSQNAWPGLRWDVGSALSWAQPMLPVGFQYKTFKGPARIWPHYERAIRLAAGLGRSPRQPDPDRYEHLNLTADILVVGGGLAGLAAAEAASAQGLSVVLAEETHRLGGIADAYDGSIDERPMLDWVRARVGALAASSNVHILTATTVAGLYDHGLALLVERVAEKPPGPEPDNVPRERLWKLRTRAVVVASGAFEKPLVFPDNDRPGAMLATSARLYARRYGVPAGKRLVIATAGDEGYRTAFDLIAAGATVERIVDLRLNPDGALFHIARARGIPVSPGSAPFATAWRRGALAGVTVGNRLAFEAPARTDQFACDTLLMSGGWSPAPHLAGHLGARMEFDPALGCFRPGALPPGLFVAGAANARFDAAAVLDDGWRAGAEAAAHVLGAPATAPRRAPVVDITADEPVEPVGMLPDISSAAERSRAFVDFQNDVTVADMELSVREGYSAPEHLKRYAALGLGTDQGRLATANAALILAGLTHADPSAIPHTTFRPPWSPTTFGTLAGPHIGALFQPLRRTPLAAVRTTALLEPLGSWLLQAVFPLPGEPREEAVRREVRAVRQGIGLGDASAAARIAVTGPDAATLLDRISPTDLVTIPVGSSRYALFLNEDGFLMEDGVVARLGAERFLVTAALGRGERLAAWFERHRQLRGPDLRVAVIDETERWGALLLAGPRVPELLARIPTSIDLDTFTADACVEATIFDLPMRALASRHTAGAEIEIAVPSGFLPALWHEVLAAGADLGLTAFGTEALHRLRLEAGAFDLDRETDGTVTPFDLGLGGSVASHKPDFIGRHGLERPAMTGANRRHLVGLLMDDPGLIPPPGAHLVTDPDQAAPRRTLGHITSSGYSPTLRRSLALALVRDDEHHLGDTVFIVLSGEGKPARIVPADFLAQEGTTP